MTWPTIDRALEMFLLMISERLIELFPLHILAPPFLTGRPAFRRRLKCRFRHGSILLRLSVDAP